MYVYWFDGVCFVGKGCLFLVFYVIVLVMVYFVVNFNKNVMIMFNSVICG